MQGEKWLADTKKHTGPLRSARLNAASGTMAPGTNGCRDEHIPEQANTGANGCGTDTGTLRNGRH